MTVGQSNTSPRSASRREREIEGRRRLILDAAVQVFRKKGIALTTMDEIAATAELSKGTLYLYFGSKEDLYLSLSNDMLDQIIVGYEQVERELKESSGRERVAAMLRAYAKHAVERHEIFRLMTGRLSQGAEHEAETETFRAHAERVTRLVQLMREALAAGQRDGSIEPSLDPTEVSTQAWGGMIGIILISLNFAHVLRRVPQGADGQDSIRAYVDIFVHGLRPR